MYRIAVLLSAVLSLFAQPDWRAATSYPGVDLKSLTPAQQKVALAVLRDTGCPCGCNMQNAECRIKDPQCGQSTTLAGMIVEAAKAGKNEAAVRKVVAESALVKAAAQRNRILLDPITINVLGAPVKGPATAKITIIEFSDFQCPFCIRAVPQLDALMQAYPKDIRLIYKQFPLESHSQAAVAARASLAAHAQGKFWPLHDKMYANARAINREAILAWAKELGIEIPKFTKLMDSPETQAIVNRDLEDGGRAGVAGTPTIFINGKKFQGAVDMAQLKPIIEQELKGK